MFLQVGSKNAGFFMGSSIKVATKRADELYVHELCLAAADLEARYQAREVRRQGLGDEGLGCCCTAGQAATAVVLVNLLPPIHAAPHGCTQARPAPQPLPSPHLRVPPLQEVYVEDMVHRNPGDPSTLTAMEQPFSVARAWVAAEGEPDGGALGGALGGDGTAGSFTRVVIGDLKPDVLRQIMDGEQGGHVCQVGMGTVWAG